MFLQKKKIFHYTKKKIGILCWLNRAHHVDNNVVIGLYPYSQCEWVIGDQVLNDWTTGKLRYYTLPPETAAADESPCDSQLVTKMRAEFNLDQLEPDMIKTVQG